LSRSIILPLFLSLLFSIPVLAEDGHDNQNKIDQRSYRLGGVATFAEMVHVGVKKLGLSAAVSPEEMDAMEADMRRIAKKENVLVYRETDLIVTDLFPEDVALGKDVMMIYKGSTLNEYLALKQQKARLVRDGNYRGESRKNIARMFGKLLSYPDAVIEEKIKQH